VVSLSVANDHASLPVAYRLYLPPASGPCGAHLPASMIQLGCDQSLQHGPTNLGGMKVSCIPARALCKVAGRFSERRSCIIDVWNEENAAFRKDESVPGSPKALLSDNGRRYRQAGGLK